MLSGMLCSMFQRQHIEMGGMCSILCLTANWVACCTAYCVGQYLVLSGADDVERFVLGCQLGSMFHRYFWFHSPGVYWAVYCVERHDGQNYLFGGQSVSMSS